MAAVSLTVNGKSVTADVDSRTLLVQLLREHLRLTGTHVGCDTSQCGACVVLVNGRAVKRTPVAALSALPIAGATGLIVFSAIDFEPSGPIASNVSAKKTSVIGASANVGIR